MPRLSLTDFVDIVSAGGTPKANKVARVKNRKEYNPAFDFYKPLRDKIIETHKFEQNKKNIRDLLVTITDTKKQSLYPVVIQGYLKWWGRKSLIWFNPPGAVYSKHGIDIKVNPELGLEINGDPHLVKLYFKADPLTRNRVEVIHFLIEKRLSSRCPSGTKMSVLDIRRSKLLVPTSPNPNLAAILDAEMAYIAALWPNIPS